MGIVFGRTKTEVRVLKCGGIHETQSLPTIKHGPRQLSVRSTSYHTVLPIKEHGYDMDTVPRLLPPLPNAVSDARPICNFRPPDTQLWGRRPTLRSEVTPEVISELVLSSEEEDKEEDLFLSMQKEKTLLIESIIRCSDNKGVGGTVNTVREGDRRKEEEILRDLVPLQERIDVSRERKRRLRSRGSVKKCSRGSRDLGKRPLRRRGSYMSESSLSSSEQFISEESYERSEKESDNDLESLLACGGDGLEINRSRDIGPSKLSKRSTIQLNHHLDLSSSSREGIRIESLKRAGSLRKTNSFQRRARRLQQSHALATHGQITTNHICYGESRVQSRATSAWHSSNVRVTANPQNVDDYDGDWEMSSSDSDEDGLDYATRRKTNPFLTSASRMTRRPPRNRNAPSLPIRQTTSQIIDTSVLHFLPDYAKQTYKSLQKPTVIVQPVVKVLEPLVRDKTFVRDEKCAQNNSWDKRVMVQQCDKRVRCIPKQNDGFDELDNAIDLLSFII